jgi:hypothetical protein
LIFSKQKEFDSDRTIFSARLMKIGMDAIDYVASELNLDFYSMDFEEKKAFICDNGKKIMERAIESGGYYGRYFSDRVVLLVENNGNAGLIFTKKKK